MDEYTKTLHEVASQQLSKWFKICPGFSSYTERTISSSNWFWRCSFGGAIFVSFVKFATPLVTFVRFTKPSVSLLSKKHTPLEHKVCVKNARFTMARTRLTRKNDFATRAFGSTT